MRLSGKDSIQLGEQTSAQVTADAGPARARSALLLLATRLHLVLADPLGRNGFLAGLVHCIGNFFVFPRTHLPIA